MGSMCVYGAAPVAISSAVMPRDQMSAFSLYPCCSSERATSQVRILARGLDLAHRDAYTQSGLHHTLTCSMTSGAIQNGSPTNVSQTWVRVELAVAPLLLTGRRKTEAKCTNLLAGAFVLGLPRDATVWQL
jgi:hypothetical protein